MIGGAALTIINNVRNATFTEAGLWLVIAALALAGGVIAVVEWRRHKRKKL